MSSCVHLTPETLEDNQEVDEQRHCGIYEWNSAYVAVQKLSGVLDDDDDDVTDRKNKK